MRYIGGKFRCYQKIINLIPPHRVYIESHLGGGAVLRNKAPAQFSIGIDRDPRAVSAFSDFPPSYQFVCGRAEDYLRRYRFMGDEFVYADPPYWRAARASQRKVYRFDYEVQDHVVLLGLLRTLPCKVMISGYDNALYREMLGDWRRETFMGTSHIGRRRETLWCNYQGDEVHDVRYLGHTFRERQSIRRKRERWLARFSRESPRVQQAIFQDLERAYTTRRTAKSQP